MQTMDSSVFEFDIDLFKTVMLEAPSAENGWIFDYEGMIDTNFPDSKIRVYNKIENPKCGFMTRIDAILRGIEAKNFILMCRDIKFRKKAKHPPNKIKIIDKRKNTDVIYVELDLPYPLINRDLVQKRLFLGNKEDSELIKKLGLFDCSHEYHVMLVEPALRPEYPVMSQPIRGEMKTHYMILEEDTVDKNVLKMRMVMNMDLAGDIPEMFMASAKILAEKVAYIGEEAACSVTLQRVELSEENVIILLMEEAPSIKNGWNFDYEGSIDKNFYDSTVKIYNKIDNVKSGFMTRIDAILRGVDIDNLVLMTRDLNYRKNALHPPKTIQLIENRKNADIIYIELNLPDPLINRDLVQKRLFVGNKEDPELAKELGLFDWDHRYYAVLTEPTQRPEYFPIEPPVRGQVMHYMLLEEDPYNEGVVKMRLVVNTDLAGNIPEVFMNAIRKNAPFKLMTSILGCYYKFFGKANSQSVALF